MSEPLLGECWHCWSVGSDPDPSCEECGGAGVVPVKPEHAMHRRKVYLGRAHPLADHNGNERWERFGAEVPPELAQVLDRVQRRLMGNNAGSATRAGLVRAALLEWLERHDPPPGDDLVGADAEAEGVEIAGELAGVGE